MQSTSRAPVLSATLSRDSCWITDGALQDLYEAPALGAAERPALDHAHGVAHVGVVGLVVRVQRGRGADDLPVAPVLARRCRSRTVIVLSALSETTTPWRIFARPAVARRVGAVRPRGGGASRRSRRRRGRRCGCVALLRRASARSAARSSSERGGRASPCAPSARACGAPWGESCSSGSAGLGGPPRRARGRRLGGRLLGLRLLGGAAPRPPAPRPRAPRRVPPRRASRASLPRSRSLRVSAICRLCLRISISTSMPRCRATVSARARSRFACFSRAVFSSCPVACWKRRLNTSWRALSDELHELRVLQVMHLGRLRHWPAPSRMTNFVLHGQLVAGEAHRLAGQRPPARRTARTSRGRA